jgi:membrane-associated PAP2 superfamily phosphatase
MPHRTLHYLIPLALMCLAIASQYSGLDIWLAQHFYDHEHHVWLYQNSWALEKVFHRGGRTLIGIFMIGVLLTWVLSFVVKRWRHLRLPTGYILVTALTSLEIVSELKSITHMYSPWDLQVFGGANPHVRLFDSADTNSPIGYAFPAGHAAGGYILLSLYFWLQHTMHRYRYAALALAIIVGMSFGIAQQIRGAHMLSHDLTTIAICWLSCLVWAKLLLQRKRDVPPVVKTAQTPDMQLLRR